MCWFRRRGVRRSRFFNALYANGLVYFYRLNVGLELHDRLHSGDFSLPRQLLPLVYYTLQGEYLSGLAQQYTYLGYFGSRTGSCSHLLLMIVISKGFCFLPLYQNEAENDNPPPFG